MSSAPQVCGGAEGTYGRAFFDKQSQASYRSSGPILQAAFELVECTSVVDVGCGVGPWLRAVGECGVDDFLGIDGQWVPADRLAIPADRFLAHDLRQPLELGRRFDLAICVEVAEHLPADAAATLVRTLTSLAPAILFSAAVPDQGGDGHINEQWPDYWARLFRAHGFGAHDCIRLPLWNDPRVDWWYRQNVLLYADRGRAPVRLGEPVDEPAALIHPEMIQAILTRPPAVPPAAPTPSAGDEPAGRRSPTWSTVLAGWAGIRRLAHRTGGSDR